MTVLLIAPERIGIMLLDASDDVRHVFAEFPESIEDIQRPCWYIADDGGEQPPGAAGIETPLERFRLQFIGVRYGVGMKGTAERESRQIVHDTLKYFAAREQLQFSNVRSLQARELTGLNGVKWARITNRTAVAVASRQGVEGEFWGAELTLSIQGAYKYEQVLVANVPVPV